MGRVTSEIHMLSCFGLLGKQKTPRGVVTPSGASITAVVGLDRRRLTVDVACNEMYYLYAHYVKQYYETSRCVYLYLKVCRNPFQRQTTTRTLLGPHVEEYHIEIRCVTVVRFLITNEC